MMQNKGELSKSVQDYIRASTESKPSSMQFTEKGWRGSKKPTESLRRSTDIMVKICRCWSPRRNS